MGCIENLPICKARCCRHISFTVLNLSEDLKYYYGLHNCVITRNKNRTYTIIVPVKCSALNDDYTCKLHGKNKPKVCEAFGRDTLNGHIVFPECIYHEV